MRVIDDCCSDTRPSVDPNNISSSFRMCSVFSSLLSEIRIVLHLESIFFFFFVLFNDRPDIDSTRTYLHIRFYVIILESKTNDAFSKPMRIMSSFAYSDQIKNRFSFVRSWFYENIDHLRRLYE